MNSEETCSVYYCSPVNSTLFCGSCNCAVLDSQSHCPCCERKVIPENPRLRHKEALCKQLGLKQYQKHCDRVAKLIREDNNG